MTRKVTYTVPGTRVARLAETTQRDIDAPRARITPRKIAAFTTAMGDQLRNGDGAFRKAYLRLFVERIEVDDREIRISGSKAALARGVSEAASLRKGAVPSFVADWRPSGDSNPLTVEDRSFPRRKRDIRLGRRRRSLPAPMRTHDDPAGSFSAPRSSIARPFRRRTSCR